MNSLQLKIKKITTLLLLVLLINLSISITYAQNQEMVLIEAGDFNMGYNYDATGTWWYPTEIPVHTVYISVFHMDKYEIFKTQWDSVYLWAVDNGYSFDNVGEAQAPNHPVYNINWYDVVKWCNARSEKEGLTPVYYTDLTQNTIYRSGQIDLYTTIISQPSFGRVVQKLSGCRLVEIIVALLELWIEGEVVLAGDPE